jgi:MFS family permease
MAVSRDADAAGADRWGPALAWLLWALTLFGLAAILWLDHLMRRAGRPELTIRAHELTYVGALAGMVTVGAVLAGRRPRHPVGWLMLALGLTVTVDGATDGYARYGLLASPGAVPGVRHLRTLGDTFALWPACIGFILLLTPTGRLPSPRWRWWAWIAVVAPLSWKAATVLGSETVVFPPFYSFPNPYFVPALAAPAMVVALPALAITLLSVVVGGASLVVRFRRARGEERQRLRWVAFAAVVAAAGIPVAVAGIAIGSPAVVGVAVLGSALVLCLAIAAAILRYRLYDIDRIISRTLAYALLTLLLGLGYAGVVLGLGRLLPHSSSLAVAAATLVAAAAFQPARRRLQQVVDRRFNRRRHDAAQLIQGFGTRLRDQVDLDTLTGDLLTVVDQTMQPTQASLWLRPQRST